MPADIGSALGNLVDVAVSGRTSPKVPAAPVVDPAAATLANAKGNLAALPTLEQVAQGVDSFNIGQRQSALAKTIPGYSGLLSQYTGNLSSELAGQVPSGVANQVATSDAAKALAGGYSGSGMQGALTARDLGLTSLQFEQQGQQQFPGFLNTMANVAIPQPFNVASGMMTPHDTLSGMQFNANNQFSRDWLQNQLTALGSPMDQALGQVAGSATSLVADAALAYATGGGSLLAGQTGGLFGGGGGGSGLLGGGSGSGMTTDQYSPISTALGGPLGTFG